MTKKLLHQLNEVSEIQCINLLKQKKICHVGCYDGTSPYVVPMNYLYDSGVIYCHSRPGKKLQIFADHPSACIQVEDIADFSHWESVIVWGKFQEVKGEEATSVFRQMIKTYQQDSLPPLELEFSAYLDRASIYRFTIERMSGRSENWGTRLA